MSDQPITPAQARGKFVGRNEPTHTEEELLIIQINESLAETQVLQGSATPRVTIPARPHSETVRARIIELYEHPSVGWNVQVITVGGVDYLEFWEG